MSQIARSPTQLGDALRRFRTLAGRSQSEIAALAGLRQATISKVESGYGAVRMETIFAILVALDLELNIDIRSQSSAQDIEDIF
jgi:HTH-type transcriptional regulator/antitoxin HipB